MLPKYKGKIDTDGYFMLLLSVLVIFLWTGIGAVGTVILGIALFDEPRNMVRLVCIAMIILGIAGLKLSSPS